LRDDGISLSDYKNVFLPEYRSSGAYRKIIQFARDFEFSCIRYDDCNAELARTELSDFGCDRPHVSISDEGSILALKLAFSLPPGTYATMFLRELTKESTDVMHQSSLTDLSRSRKSQNEKCEDINPISSSSASAEEDTTIDLARESFIRSAVNDGDGIDHIGDSKRFKLEQSNY